MRKHPKHILSFMTGAVLLLFALAIPGAFADTTVTLDQPVHFTNAEGSDDFFGDKQPSPDCTEATTAHWAEVPVVSRRSKTIASSGGEKSLRTRTSVM